MLEGFEDAVMGRSDNGWMDSELFVQWLKTVFVPDIDTRQIKRPVILCVVGHKTHMSLEASDVCQQNGVILYCLLQHASHLMQPCDLQLFGVLKETWKIALRQWQIKHVGQYVTKYEFANIFKHAWTSATKVEVAVKGFKDAGLYPLDKEAVLKTDKFQTSKLFEARETNRPEEPLDNTPKETIQSAASSVETSIVNTDTGNTDADRSKENKSVTGEKEHAGNGEVEDKENIANKATNQMKTDSPLSKVLKTPVPMKIPSRTKRSEPLPKAITGAAFRAILMERKRKREEEEQAKEQRKQDRIKKRGDKEKLKQEKTEQRLAKMKDRQEKKEEKLRMKEVQKKLKALQKKKEKVESDDDSSNYSVHDESDNDIDVDPNKCYKCGGSEECTGWIGCQRCFRFFHRKCTDIDLSMMTEEEIEGFPFECLFC